MVCYDLADRVAVAAVDGDGSDSHLATAAAGHAPAQGVGWAVLPFLALALAVGLTLTPTAVGYHKRRQGRTLAASLSEVGTEGWGSLRARGYHDLSVRAERRNWHRVVALLTKRAHRFAPDKPQYLWNLATNLREAGKPDEALAYY